MISSLSDDNVEFLIEIIHRLMSRKSYETGTQPVNKGAMQAFYRPDAAKAEIERYLPRNFDPDRKLEKVGTERYGDSD